MSRNQEQPYKLSARGLARIKRWDRVAQFFITSGGMLVLVFLFLMIAFLAWITLPLFRGSEASPMGPVPGPLPSDTVFFDIGPFSERFFLITAGGAVEGRYFGEGETERFRLQLSSEAEVEVTIREVQKVEEETYALALSDGRVLVERIHFQVDYDPAGRRRTTLASKRLTTFDGLAGSDVDGRFKVHVDEESTVLVRLLEDSRFYICRRSKKHRIGEEAELEIKKGFLETGLNARITDFLITEKGRRLILGADSGAMAICRIEDPELPRLFYATTMPSGHGIDRMSWVYGKQSFIIAEPFGALSGWTYLPQENKLEAFHTLPSHRTRLRALFHGFKDKTIVGIDEAGIVQVSYLTSERLIHKLTYDSGIKDAVLSSRGDRLLASTEDGRLVSWQLDAGHPEVSAATLWGKVQYEGYSEPDFIWQSSGAHDTFEAKMSLTPLVFGSLKGVFFGMLFSLPLALFAAMYVSHLMEPRFRAVIKPAVELMAAVPTVILGMVAALWLAPRLEHHLLGLTAALLTLPTFVLVSMWVLVRRGWKTTGREFLFVLPLLLPACYLAFYLGDILEARLFDNNLNLWLFTEWGLRVDQRNALVVSFALGFAVIPIVFTISEDALHNVPSRLVAAASALGSSRWQTLRRVVLPPAAPGIFAAVMIGFGRAVGETMIVLMVTGNTPIMSFDIFEGMRTLSANIAVEIPEAPVGSTLYRVLFLSAALLFVLTFFVNSLAEVVRTRLRQKYRNL